MNDPILITGFQRSGTTMLAYILNSHFPKITNESGVIDTIIRDYGDKVTTLNCVVENRYSCKVDYIGTLVTVPNKLEIKRIYNMLYEQGITKKDFTQDENTLVKTTILDEKEITKKHLDFWGDKTTNFAKYLKPFKIVFPESKIIYIVRSGFDSVASSLRLGWGEELDLWARWCDDVEHFLEWQNSNSNCLLVRQEDLIHNPKKVCRNLSVYLGIDIDIELFNSFIYKASNGEKATKRTTNSDNYISIVPLRAHKLMKRLKYV